MIHSSDRSGFLARLARDARGNTLAIMAAMLIPLAAFSGSAIDMARLYVVKVRLQQACDAGVLAGRKFMDNTSTASTLDTNAATQATNFFNNNFNSGWFSTSNISFIPTKTSDSQVAGSASVIVPMTIMKMFGKPQQQVTVTCQARYDIADTDVMFVLDVTGSMSCAPTDITCSSTTALAYKRADGSTDYYNPENSGSKLQAVRDAVSSFYDTMVKSADASTHIRYGFVPYNSSVNVGAAVYALSSSYFVSSWNYQSRKINATNPSTSTSTTQTYPVTSQAACNAYASARSPATGYDSNGRAQQTTVNYYSQTTGSGQTAITKYYCDATTTTTTPNWTYTQVTGVPTTSYAATINGGSVTDPSKVTGATSTWSGCIEERQTTSGNDDVSDYDITKLPPDLDPDLFPTSEATRWAPQWPSLVYARANGSKPKGTNNGGTGGGFTSFNSTADYSSNAEFTTSPDDSSDGPYTPNYMGYSALKGGFATCPQAARPLATMTKDDVNAYTKTLLAHGGTYHDVGMIWGTRMLSPNGIFKNTTKPWPGRNDPQRVIVFLTDGQMAPMLQIYGAYGIEAFDRRVTGAGSGVSDATDYHNARFLAECAKAKSENISVWVVAVGQSLTDPLTQCATKSSQALYAGTGADLTTAFQTIAKQVAMLRIAQ